MLKLEYVEGFYELRYRQGQRVSSQSISYNPLDNIAVESAHLEDVYLRFPTGKEWDDFWDPSKAVSVILFNFKSMGRFFVYNFEGIERLELFVFTGSGKDEQGQEEEWSFFSTDSFAGLKTSLKSLSIHVAASVDENARDVHTDKKETTMQSTVAEMESAIKTVPDFVRELVHLEKLEFVFKNGNISMWDLRGLTQLREVVFMVTVPPRPLPPVASFPASLQPWSIFAESCPQLHSVHIQSRRLVARASNMSSSSSSSVSSPLLESYWNQLCKDAMMRPAEDRAPFRTMTTASLVDFVIEEIPVGLDGVEGLPRLHGTFIVDGFEEKAFALRQNCAEVFAPPGKFAITYVARGFVVNDIMFELLSKYPLVQLSLGNAVWNSTYASFVYLNRTIPTKSLKLHLELSAVHKNFVTFDTKSEKRVAVVCIPYWNSKGSIVDIKSHISNDVLVVELVVHKVDSVTIALPVTPYVPLNPVSPDTFKGIGFVFWNCKLPPNFFDIISLDRRVDLLTLGHPYDSDIHLKQMFPCATSPTPAGDPPPLIGGLEFSVCCLRWAKQNRTFLHRIGLSKVDLITNNDDKTKSIVTKNWFCSSPYVTSIFLKNMGIKSVEKDAFVFLKEIVEINLSQNNISELYPGMIYSREYKSSRSDRFDVISMLDISDNALTTLPKGLMFDESYFYAFNVSSNALNAFSFDTFGKLPKCGFYSCPGYFFIVISHNNITSLTGTLYEFYALNHIDVAGVYSDVTDGLYHLVASHNAIQEIKLSDDLPPNSTTANRNLAAYFESASRNGISVEDAAVNVTRTPLVIDLSYNNVTTLRVDSFRNLWSLSSIDLRNNTMETIEAGSISGNTCFSHGCAIDLSNNAIGKNMGGLESFFRNHIANDDTSVLHIALSNNGLTRVPKYIGNMVKSAHHRYARKDKHYHVFVGILRENLINNITTSLCDGMLKELRSGNNRLGEGLIALYIDLSFNNISYIAPNAFDCGAVALFVNLNNNPISELPPIEELNSSLYLLSAADTNITQLPRSYSTQLLVIKSLYINSTKATQCCLFNFWFKTQPSASFGIINPGDLDEGKESVSSPTPILGLINRIQQASRKSSNTPSVTDKSVNVNDELCEFEGTIVKFGSVKDLLSDTDCPSVGKETATFDDNSTTTHVRILYAVISVFLNIYVLVCICCLLVMETGETYFIGFKRRFESLRRYVYCFSYLYLLRTGMELETEQRDYDDESVTSDDESVSSAVNEVGYVNNESKSNTTSEEQPVTFCNRETNSDNSSYYFYNEYYVYKYTYVDGT
eukprot:Nk52_evm5s282 gene=Nk52_evmTU5s282